MFMMLPAIENDWTLNQNHNFCYNQRVHNFQKSPQNTLEKNRNLCKIFNRGIIRESMKILECIWKSRTFYQTLALKVTRARSITSACVGTCLNLCVHHPHLHHPVCAQEQLGLKCFILPSPTPLHQLHPIPEITRTWRVWRHVNWIIIRAWANKLISNRDPYFLQVFSRQSGPGRDANFDR